MNSFASFYELNQILSEGQVGEHLLKAIGSIILITESKLRIEYTCYM